MSFDDALTVVLAKPGVAMKTERTIGYVVNYGVPSGSGAVASLVFKYRDVTGPSYPIYDGDDGYYVSSEPQSPVQMTGEFLSLVLSDGWYTCFETECEAAAEKAASVDDDV